MISILSKTFIFLKMNPLIPADTPKIPVREVMIIRITSNRFVFIKSKAGFNPNTYGTINAAIASSVAFIAVFIGEAFAIAEPA